jgi:hypothetical protein
VEASWLETRCNAEGAYLRIRYLLLFTTLRYLLIEDRWCRQGRVSMNSSGHPGRAH